MFLACTTVWAQDVVRDSVAVADTADTEENVIGVKPRHTKRQKHEANVLGAPVYYNINGQERGGERTTATYRRPRHHYLNQLSNRYCSTFFEGEVLFGASNLAIGANLSVLPERWGGYGSMLFGGRTNYFSVGPALRLSGYESVLDWHLYGGAVFTERHIGGEVGLRMASPRHKGRFCWMSTSLGLAVVDGDTYMTFGLSMAMTGLVLLAL